MSGSSVALANQSSIEECLKILRRDGVRNATAIQDLTRWFDRSKFFFIRSDDRLSYLHVSGHPASHDLTTVVLDGDQGDVRNLLRHCKLSMPVVIRETDASYESVIREFFPDAKIYQEFRMDVTAKTYRPQHKGLARQLTEKDALALAVFNGIPPQAASQAAQGFMGWIKGAKSFQGVFIDDLLASMGSSMVSIPESWNLVSISTHKNFRGKGFATEVTSSLVECALKETSVVTVTVVKDNSPAIHVYEKIGFVRTQDRIWADCGANAAP